MSEGKLFIIRHATSTYNVASKDYVAAHGTRKHMPLKWDPAFIDSDLTDGGIAEALAAKDSFSALPVHTVLVSPFRRALHTCELLFSDSPLRSHIKVCPLISEKCGNAPDLSAFLGEPFEEYRHYDWEEMRRFEGYWLLDNVKNAHTDRIQREAGSKQQALEMMLGTMKELYPEKLENKEDVFRRIDLAKAYLKRELSTGSVAIVTHSNFTKHFFLRVFGHPQWLDNCTMLEVTLP